MKPHEEQATATTFFLKLNSDAASDLKRISHRLPLGKISPRSRSVEPHLGQVSVFIDEGGMTQPMTAAVSTAALLPTLEQAQELTKAKSPRLYRFRAGRRRRATAPVWAVVVC